MKKLIIIPDVHGREFWKDALDYIKEGVETVFLGDYVNPYGFEGITKYKALQNFIDILNSTNDYPNCKKLIGNHDCTYIFPDEDICECRTDYINLPQLKYIFNKNIHRFNLAWKKEIGDKTFLLSHAGINLRWLDWLNKKTGKNIDDLLGPLDEIDPEIISCLGVISCYRSGYGGTFGSLVWADYREFILHEKESKLNNGMTQIVGHTLIDKPLYVKDLNMAFLDTKQCYYIDEEGNIRYLNDDSLVS